MTGHYTPLTKCVFLSIRITDSFIYFKNTVEAMQFVFHSELLIGLLLL